MNRSSEFAAYFARLGRDVLGESDGALSFAVIAQRSVEVIPACDFASITMRRGGRFMSAASTSRTADRCDEWQYELDEGPCLDAIADDEFYVIDDVARDPRWPRWGPRAAESGAGSILSVRLANDREPLGALNLYAAEPHAFDPDSVDLALVYASHAAAAISSSRLVAGLQTALQSRHLIGVAQGILMAQYDMGLETAFEVLRRYSNHANVKLRDVAARVVELRALPEDYTGFVSNDRNGARAEADEQPAPAPSA